MLKELDNRFSFSMDTVIKDVNLFIENFDDNYEYINLLISKPVDLFKKYLGDDKLYDDWLKYISQEVHASITKEEKENCKVCRGISKLEEDKICEKYLREADFEFYLPIVLFVGLIEANEHLFKSKEALQSLSYKLFVNFSFENGKLIFDANNFDSIFLTHIILTIRENLKDMGDKEALLEVTEAIEELETHKLIAKSANRVLSNFVNPQLKFLKKQQKFFKEKLKNDKSKDKDTCNYSEYKNLFCNSMPIEDAVNHFKIFTEKNSKNGKPFLTETQFDIFIKKAFCGIPNLKKQKFNMAPKGESTLVKYRFREFYESYYQYFGTGHVLDKFVELLTDNFVGWDFKNVKVNFNKKPSKTIQLLK